PWTQAERFELLDWMAEWGLNTYLYAPKDDLKHRLLWRECYATSEAEDLAGLIRACRGRSLRFLFALSPGLDICYSSETDFLRVRSRLEQMVELGCHEFALLWDDIGEELGGTDRERFGSLAAAQCHVSNTLLQWMREHRPEARLFFCPTAYCGRM